jgi:glutamate/tyrosine decarboxylase-like PLP-dependent enzyme
MNVQLKDDLDNLDSVLEAARFQSVLFLSEIDSRPTIARTEMPVHLPLNENGLGAIDTLKLFNAVYEKLIVASSGPRYWGFVTGGSTPAAVAGDWLAAVYDQNTQSVKGQGDVSANIEIETIKLLLELFQLPADFLGGFVTGATMSNFTCLAVARQWVGRQQGRDFAREGVSSDIKVLAAVPHSSAVKSLAMLGIGSANFIKVNLAEGNREAIDISDLENRIAKLNGAPFILISSAGTVNTVDFDDFGAIARLKLKYNFWWHIDGAFGAFASCSPRYKHLLDGWEFADSITVDCHKWLNVPYESAVFLINETHNVLQMETFQNSNAPYLGNPLENFSYLNFLPENSRRLKALPVWFTLRAYGKTGYREIVENSVELARQFGNYIDYSTKFVLMAPVRLNNVCFTLRGEENQDRVSEFLFKLNDTGKVFMTPTVYNGKKAIRAAFVNWRTTEQDVKLVIKEMEQIII